MHGLDDREPILLTEDQRGLWLYPASDKETLLDVIAAPAHELQFYAMCKALGNFRDNSATLRDQALHILGT